MLDFLRQRAGSWMVKIMLGAIIVVFIFWGVGSFRTQRANLLAKVNGEPITLTQFQRLYAQRLEQLQQMFRGQLTDELLKQLNLPGQIFEELVRRVLIAQAAEEMGLKVTADEVRLAIARIHVFQENGRFSPERYRLILRGMRISPTDFETEVKTQLLEAKLRRLLTTPIVATTSEARERFLFANEALKVGYVKLSVSQAEKEIKPTEAELKKYFEAYKELYRTSLKLKLAYYLLPYDEVRKEIKVTKEEIKEYYDNHKDTEFFRPEARKIRHILVVVKPGADEAKARKKAEKILAQIKSPKDFARLAQKYSDDPHSRNQGGDLGYVTKNEIFESLRGPIFSAKEGEIIGPLRSPLGYHIILVEKIRKAGYLPLKEAEAKIKAKIADRKLKDLAWDKANQIYDEVILLGGLEKWAEKHGVSLSTTPLLSVNEPPADPAITSEVIEAAQKLEKGELGPLFEVQKGILIFKLAKRDNPHIPDFSKVEERVKRDYVREKARELSRKKAEELLTKLKEAKDEALVLKEAGLELKETDFFKRKEALGKSGLPPEVARASVTLASKGKWLEQPVSTAEAFYLLKLTDLKPADLKEFDKEKEALKERLTQEKRQRAFSTWYKHLRETAEIRLYHKIPNT